MPDPFPPLGYLLLQGSFIFALDFGRYLVAAAGVAAIV